MCAATKTIWADDLAWSSLARPAGNGRLPGCLLRDRLALPRACRPRRRRLLRREAERAGMGGLARLLLDVRQHEHLHRPSRTGVRFRAQLGLGRCPVDRVLHDLVAPARPAAAQSDRRTEVGHDSRLLRLQVPEPAVEADPRPVGTDDPVRDPLVHGRHREGLRAPARNGSRRALRLGRGGDPRLHLCLHRGRRDVRRALDRRGPGSDDARGRTRDGCHPVRPRRRGRAALRADLERPRTSRPAARRSATGWSLSEAWSP